MAGMLAVDLDTSRTLRIVNRTFSVMQAYVWEAEYNEPLYHKHACIWKCGSGSAHRMSTYDGTYMLETIVMI